MSEPRRCHWARNPLNIRYHDREWGVPVHHDRKLFEFLILEGAQAGLSWDTILRKRARYRRVFDGFDARKIARYDARKVRALLADPGIIRNRLKIQASISNAKAFLAVQKEFDSFDCFLWQFAPPPRRRALRHDEIQARTPASDRMSKELARRGFRFVGSTICYALMQAVGMVNDHTRGCFRYAEIVAHSRHHRGKAAL